MEIPSNQLSEVQEFDYLGSVTQNDGSRSRRGSISRRVQSGWNKWKMSGVLCDRRIPPQVKGKIHKMVIQPAMLYRPMQPKPCH